VRTISREVAGSPSQAVPLTPQRLHAELLETSAFGARAYLHGAAHDATVSSRHRTVRFGQSDVRWLEVLRILIARLGGRSWRYREGRSRRFWILEASADVLAERPTFSCSEERLAYARGYFDAEGGTPRDPSARFYLQFVQKNHGDINELRTMLEAEGIWLWTASQPEPTQGSRSLAVLRCGSQPRCLRHENEFVAPEKAWSVRCETWHRTTRMKI
jgi:hypothetical protein